MEGFKNGVARGDNFGVEPGFRDRGEAWEMAGWCGARDFKTRITISQIARTTKKTYNAVKNLQATGDAFIKSVRTQKSHRWGQSPQIAEKANSRNRAISQDYLNKLSEAREIKNQCGTWRSHKFGEQSASQFRGGQISTLDPWRARVQFGVDKIDVLVLFESRWCSQFLATKITVWKFQQLVVADLVIVRSRWIQWVQSKHFSIRFCKNHGVDNNTKTLVDIFFFQRPCFPSNIFLFMSCAWTRCDVINNFINTKNKHDHKPMNIHVVLNFNKLWEQWRCHDQ